MTEWGQRCWLVAYDITEPRRLERVRRCVARRALRIQFSLYLLAGSPATLDALVRELRREIDPRADDVRIYALPPQTRVEMYGVGAQPAGVYLIDDGLVGRFWKMA